MTSCTRTFTVTVLITFDITVDYFIESRVSPNLLIKKI
jgi:hypothetical protein